MSIMIGFQEVLEIEKEGRRLGAMEERKKTQKYLKWIKEEYWKERDVRACELVGKILKGLERTWKGVETK